MADSPTPADLAFFRAYLDAGSIRETARQLGVHEQTVKRHLASVRRHLDVKTNAQAAVRLVGKY